MCAPHACVHRLQYTCPMRKQEKGVRSPGAELRGSCRLLAKVLKLNTCALQEQYSFFTTEPSL